MADDHEQHPRKHELPSRRPDVLLVYGERANAALPGKLQLDGYGLVRLEGIPRPLPLAAIVYGHDVRIVRPDADLTVRGSASQGGAGSGVLRYGELHIDTASRVVTYGLIPVALRRREYALLAHMARDPERVWTRHELLRDVWGYRSHGTTRTVDSHASRLRAKLAAAGACGWMVSEWGVGYRLAPGER